MKDLTLGEVITDTEAQRDAVHIAVAPVTAHIDLKPGQHIGFTGVDGANTVSPYGEHIGVVDPFLKRKTVHAGERFWMYLYPNTITSLRHEWSHPAFKTGKSHSRLWLEKFARSADLSYEDLIAAAADHLKTGSYLCDGGKWEGFDTPDEFWDHFHKETGIDVPDENPGGFFTCSC